jgi:uncharacterized phage infection (PIP) family protein YhgE
MNQIPQEHLREWVRETLSSKLVQAERERDKLVLETAKALEALAEYCNQLSRKAAQDMETKREKRSEYKAAKALARLTELVTEMCKSVNIPHEKNSITLRNLQRELSKTAVEGARVRAESLRQIRPYYIIDMMSFGGNIDKLRRLSEELHGFLMGRGAILKSLEELDEKMKSLDKLQTSRNSVSDQKRAIQEQLAETQNAEANLREQVEQIRQNRKMKEYVRIDGELRALRSELLRRGFSRLGRPLRKLVSISERGDYALPLEVRENTKEYLRRPFATFLEENEGYPKLKAVLTALSNGVESGKLALKQREAKKVIDRSRQVVSDNSLAGIYEEAKKHKGMYDQCYVDRETASLVARMKDLRQRGRSNYARQKELKGELQRAIDAEAKANGQIAVLTKEIEDFSSNLAGAPVRIQP